MSSPQFFPYSNRKEQNSRKIDRRKVQAKLRSLFCNGRSSASRTLIYTNAGITKVSYNDETEFLNPEQVEITKAISSDHCEVVVVRAGPGTGKTFTVAVASQHLLKLGDKGVHIVIAYTNNSVQHCVETASKLTHLDEFRIVRLISEKNFREGEIRTDFDLPFLLRKHVNTLNFINSLKNQEEFDAVQRYVDLLDANRKEELDEMDPFNDATLLRLWKKRRAPDDSGRIVIHCFLRFYQPKRYFATVDTGLAAFSKYGPLHHLHEEISLVVFDDCSQLSYATARNVITTFPEARLALVGDDRQRRPFVPQVVAEFSPEMSSENLFKRIIERKRVPIYQPILVYRGHPSLTRIISELFYDNSLQRAIRYDERSSIIKTLDMPNRDSPWALLLHPGLEEQLTVSWRNPSEEDVIVRLLVILVVVHQIPAPDISVLSIYNAQADAISNRIRQNSTIRGVFASTAEEALGREWRVVVVSTVRSTSTGATAFQTPERALMALSRAREACFVVLHDAVRFTPRPWPTLAERLRREGCVETAISFLERNQ